MNENLKELRIKLGLSQKEFAEKLLVSDATISRLEKGERKLTDRFIFQICEVFNV
ncbi:XRE family transcriptional regulator, partial [Clostridioides difficile]|nr:XRE family transcriptional regulator [Clostridioides difficile]